MASVTLTAVWITSRLDPTVSVQVHATSIAEASKIAGQVRTYAGGRQRAVSLTGTARDIPMSLSLVPRATLTTLDGWAGTTVLLRDPFGLRRWVTFWGYTRKQVVAPTDLSDVEIVFSEITVDESV